MTEMTHFVRFWEVAVTCRWILTVMFKLRAKGLAMSIQQPLYVFFFFSLLVQLGKGGGGRIILVFSAFNWLESGITTCIFVRAWKSWLQPMLPLLGQYAHVGNKITHLNKPGQLLEPHLLVWTFWPGQLAPPLLGGGLVHVLLLVCDPIPQVLEQGPQACHWDQPPFTVQKLKLIVCGSYNQNPNS